MKRPDYRLPTPSENHYRAEAKRLRKRCDELLSDSSGAAVIGKQDKTIADLKEELEQHKALLEQEKLKVVAAKAQVRENKKLMLAYKKMVSSMRFDIQVAHSQWREAERKHKDTERRRYKWAQCARRLGTELTCAKAEIRKLKAHVKRTSDNSSLPPSADITFKKVHNSRKVTGRSPGAQAGHAGHKRRTYAADKTIHIAHQRICPECGGHLVVKPPTSRQLVDVEITVHTTEYVASVCTCQTCKKRIAAPFPKSVPNESNYGNNIRALATYLTNRLNVSKVNVCRFFHAASKGEITLSTGSIHNFQAAFSKKAAPEIKFLFSQINASPLIHSDATFTRSEGKRSYIYVYATDREALFQASDHKGRKPLTTSPVADHKGVLVHDHDSAYYQFGTHHQECNVHILRYLKGVCENEPERQWAPAMTSLLCIANEACKAAREQGREHLGTTFITAIEDRYSAICNLAEKEYEDALSLPAKYQPEGIALYTRLKKFQQAHLAFLHDLSIPFDNNFSERLLRKAKGKLKQSGGFRSTKNGETHYCDFLSIVETASLRGMEPLAVVRAIFDGTTNPLEPDKTCVSDDP